MIQPVRKTKINYEHQYYHQFTQLAGIIPQGPQSDTATDLQNHILAVGSVFNQISAKAGVKRYGDKAIKAIVQECKQLDDKKAFKLRDMKSLSELKRKRALRSISPVNEKRCGRIKGRTVADGRGQREYISREDATSPTVSIEALILSIAINAKEGRAVATANVKEPICMRTWTKPLSCCKGDMVDYMVQANPEKYGPRVHTSKSGKQLLQRRNAKGPLRMHKICIVMVEVVHVNAEKDGIRFKPIRRVCRKQDDK
jgi:hypothetical protein